MSEPIRLTPEARQLLTRLVQERDEALQRLDIAILAMKAALGVPLEWQLSNLDDGFVEVQDHGGDN